MEFTHTKSLAALVVEDNQINSATISNALKLLGFKVDESTTSSKAKELIKEKEYDLLLCDTCLPPTEKEIGEDYPDNINGCELGKLFKKKSPNGVVIAMSSDEKLKENWKDISDEFYKSPLSSKLIYSLPSNLVYILKKRFNLE